MAINPFTCKIHTFQIWSLPWPLTVGRGVTTYPYAHICVRASRCVALTKCGMPHRTTALAAEQAQSAAGGHMCSIAWMSNNRNDSTRFIAAQQQQHPHHTDKILKHTKAYRPPNTMRDGGTPGAKQQESV